MKNLRESSFIDIKFDETKKVFQLTWKPETENMDEDDFKNEMIEYSKFFDLDGEHVLHRMEDMKYTIAPDLQKWLDDNINKKGIDKGIKNAAFIVSTDLFTSVSVQQANESLNAQKIPMQYFDDEDKALKWLLDF